VFLTIPLVFNSQPTLV